jgi:hypothetical protein
LLFLFHETNCYLCCKVVKTRPDRSVGPVEPGTGPISGPVSAEKRSASEPTQNRKNREKSGKNRWPGRSRRFTGLYLLKKKTGRKKKNWIFGVYVFLESICKNTTNRPQTKKEKENRISFWRLCFLRIHIQENKGRKKEKKK